MILSEKYRPKALNEVLGQPKAVAVLTRFKANQSLAGRAYWIVGASGTGKTTLARIIASEIADDFFVQEIAASDLTCAAIREMEKDMSVSAWGKGGKAYIINESHGLRQDAIRMLKDTLERLPKHVAIVFTTTKNESENLFDCAEDVSPFIDRCTTIALTNQGLAKVFAERALEIARAENLDGRPLEEYIRLAQKCKNSMRAMLAKIEAGEMLV